MKSFRIKSSNHIDVQAYSWLPDGEPDAIVQICHGMMEHSGRYDHFARWLNRHNFAVYAHDHIGHGGTIGDMSELGHFPRKDDWQRSVNIMHNLTNLAKKNHNNVPVFLLGQSMGSVMAQSYAIDHGKDIRGLILSGLVRQPVVMANIGMVLSVSLSALFGPANRSGLMVFLGYGQYNRKFRPNRTECDWLSSVDSAVDKYVNDPLCGIACSNRFYRNLFHGFRYVAKTSNLKKIGAGMPVLIIGGENDAAGNSGKVPAKIHHLFTNRAKADVTLKLYPTGRHEMLNEHNRDEVYSDLLEWMRGKVKD